MLQFQNGNTTSYLYSNDGVKRKVTHQTAIAKVVIPMGSIQPLSSGQIAYTSTTDYCGNVIYEDGILSKILTDEGYITLSGSTPTYHYYLKDHLGNNRVVMAQSGTVEQINHYYPFGGLFGEGTATSNQAYKYNGKELDRMHGLDWYDYGARFYDPAVGQWNSVDPKVDWYYSMSPYNYVVNNPIILNDPNGQWIESAWDAFSLGTGVTSLVSNIKEGNVLSAVVDGVGIFADAVALAVPIVPGGASAGIKALRAADNVIDVVQSTKGVKNASSIVENAKQGKQFEGTVTQSLKNAGHKNVAEQVTVKPNVDGAKNVRLDNVSTKDGGIKLTDAKSSQTAPMTKNQKPGYPAIEQHGGTVVGNKGAAQGYPAGTKIPPTKVNIIRPNDLNK